MSAAAVDVHVCHLFHHNSSDKNFTLRLAESVTLEAPPSDPELTPCSTPTRSRTTTAAAAAAAGGQRGQGGRGGSSPCHPNTAAAAAAATSECGEKAEGDAEAGLKLEPTREAARSSSGGKAKTKAKAKVKVKAKRGAVFRRPDDDDEEEVGGEDEDGDGDEDRVGGEDKDALMTRGGEGEEGFQFHHSSVPLLPTTATTTTTSPRSGSGSSSTELTCDCDSPDNLSDTSVSSGRSSGGGGNQFKVHHAPSLTYGILSLFRAGKGGPPSRKVQGRHKRHSRSLTDVNGLEMEMELTRPSCAYDQRTDAWACAL